jgi:hypothetical protein
MAGGGWGGLPSDSPLVAGAESRPPPDREMGTILIRHGDMYPVAMALVIPVGSGQVLHSLKLLGDPEPMAVTYGIRVEPDVGFDLNTMVAALKTAFDTTIKAQLSTAITHVQTELRFRLDPEPAGLNVAVSSSNTTGSEAGATLPQNSAYLVHKRTTTGGKGGRGRLYFPGVFEAAADTVGAVTAAEQAEWNTALGNWRTAIAAVTAVEGMVLFHDSAGAHADEPPYLVTSLTLDPIIATQRRRLRR